MIPLSKNGEISLSDDRLARRLLLGLIVSVLANVLLWAGASIVVRIVPRHDFKTVEISRVIMDKQGHKQEKIVTKKQIEKKLAVVKKEIVRRKVAMVPPKPEGAHNRILTALPSKTAPASADTHTALAGGNAPLGQAIGQQNAGNAVTNPAGPAPPPTVVQPAPAPAPVAAPPPAVKQQVVQAPPPAPKPAPRGPTKDSEAISTVQPNIPDDLRQQEFKTFVRVRVKIQPDASFTVTLRTSSGNAEIDKLVLDALNKWKWKPALRDGTPVESTQLFKFEFEVN